jgi:hypothetical protein
MGDATDRVIRHHQTVAPLEIHHVVYPPAIDGCPKTEQIGLAFGLLSLSSDVLRMVCCGKSAAANLRDAETRARAD